MRTNILYVIFLFLSMAVFGQTQLFKNYDFDKGGYSLLGIRSESDPNGLADTLGNFYTDDITILNQFKKEWVFKKSSPAYACGYHYIISICKDSKCVESFPVNLNCNEIVAAKIFYFNNQKLRKFKGKLKKLNTKYQKFDNVQKARSSRDSLFKSGKNLLIESPLWVKYEGSFRFTYVCDAGTKMCLSKADQILPKLTIELKQKYPGELFTLQDVGGSTTELDVEVECNKTLSDKFNLYKRNTSVGSLDEWTPFSYYLAWYWGEK